MSETPQETPLFEGYLTKRMIDKFHHDFGNTWKESEDSLFKSWKMHKFILRNNGDLSYYDEKNVKRGNFNVTQNEVCNSETKKKPFCLRIKREPNKYLFLFANSQAEKIRFVRALLKAGAFWNSETEPCNSIFNIGSGSDVKSVASLGDDICLKDVSEWEVGHVVEFMNHVFLPGSSTARKLYGDDLRENQVTGQKMLQLKEKHELESIGIKAKDVDTLEKAIQVLENSRIFDEGEFAVFDKISHFLNNKSDCSMELNTFMSCLTDEKLLKSNYLQMDKVKLFKADPDKYSKIIAYDVMAPPTPEEIEQLDSEELVQLQRKMGEFPHGIVCKRTKIKLIFSEIIQRNDQKAVLKALNPSAFMVPNLGQQYGMFHTALVVGPWYLEWTDSSLCVPRRITAPIILTSSDISGFYHTNYDIYEIADKVAEVVTKWNTSKRYATFKMTGKVNNEGNCQEFVDDMLKHCGIEMDLKDERYLDKMRMYGVCEMEYDPLPELKQKYGLEKTIFKTHDELDNFAKRLSTIFRLDYPEDWKLLKMFDRAFWLRSMRSKRPENVPSAQGCCFGDPLDTGYAIQFF